jgi:hypothetical protein
MERVIYIIAGLGFIGLSCLGVYTAMGFITDNIFVNGYACGICFQWTSSIVRETIKEKFL